MHDACQREPGCRGGKLEIKSGGVHTLGPSSTVHRPRWMTGDLLPLALRTAGGGVLLQRQTIKSIASTAAASPMHAIDMRLARGVADRPEISSPSSPPHRVLLTRPR